MADDVIEFNPRPVDFNVQLGVTEFGVEYTENLSEDEAERVLLAVIWTLDGLGFDTDSMYERLTKKEKSQ